MFGSCFRVLVVILVSDFFSLFHFLSMVAEITVPVNYDGLPASKAHCTYICMSHIIALMQL